MDHGRKYVCDQALGATSKSAKIPHPTGVSRGIFCELHVFHKITTNKQRENIYLFLNRCLLKRVILFRCFYVSTITKTQISKIPPHEVTKNGSKFLFIQVFRKNILKALNNHMWCVAVAEPVCVWRTALLSVCFCVLRLTYVSHIYESMN